MKLEHRMPSDTTPAMAARRGGPSSAVVTGLMVEDFGEFWTRHLVYQPSAWTSFGLRLPTPLLKTTSGA